MPIIKSAKKRVRVEATRQKRNTITKDRYRQLIKDFKALIAGGKAKEAAEMFPQVQKAIDMAAKKNQLHANTAARKKSALAKALAAKPEAKAAKPAAAKKTETKKSPAKKAE